MASIIRLLLLLDYKGQFWCSSKNPGKSMKNDLLVSLFNKYGYEVTIANFSEVAFRQNNYKGYYVLYTSQEDHDIRYKAFIEDIILGLKLQGALPIPDTIFLRAHHNKVFMEILRALSPIKEMHTIRSRYFGTYEEFVKYGQDLEYPAVIKPSAGARSKGVSKIHRSNAHATIRKTSRSFVVSEALKNSVKAATGHDSPIRSLHRKKFIVQNYIEGMDGDFKVLVFGDKFYVLRRQARKRDFRASGSGMFSWPRDVASDILEFAENVFTSLDVPCVSLDIGEADGQYHLIEFQAIMFGMYTLEQSTHHFIRTTQGWELVEGPSELEETFATAIHKYICSLLKE